eukprot:3386193-Ditylum_brightwellii.AAC.1
MPCPQPPRAQLGNLNHKGGHAKGDLPKNWCGAEGSKAGAPPLVFGGEGHWPVLHIYKGNATLEFEPMQEKMNTQNCA